MNTLPKLLTGLTVLAASIASAHAVDVAGQAQVATVPTGMQVDRFIVHYKDEGAGRAQSVVQDFSVAQSNVVSHMAVNKAMAVSAAQFSFHRRTAMGGYVVRSTHLLDSTAAQQLMAQIAANPAIASVEPDTRLHIVRDIRGEATPAVAPSDPLFNYQWHFRAGDGTAEKIGTDTQTFNNLGGANAVAARALSKGEGVVVAVIDTGATVHPDLDTTLADQSYDFITDKFMSGRSTDGRIKGAWDLGDWTTGPTYLATNGGCVDNVTIPPEPSSWHGTHVMGTIAELTDNGIGMAGVAPLAKVLPIRALGHCGGNTSDISDAVVWAAGGHVDGLDDNKNPAQVINMSLGGGGKCTTSTDMGKAIAYATGKGVTVVVAAGNSTEDATGDSPASCPGTITVAAHGITGKPTFYSNYGSVVTLSAPGGGVYANDASTGARVAAGFVWSTINKGTTVPTTPDYGTMAGTSQATPEVAGAAALMISARKAAGLSVLTPTQVKGVLASTVRPFPARPSAAYGSGLLDTNAAVIRAIDPNDTTPGNSVVSLANGILSRLPANYALSDAVYSLVVPAGAKIVTLRTLGGTGDVSLLVKRDKIPEVGAADYVSANLGNNESVTIPAPAAGVYYLRVTGISSDTSFSVLGLYTR